MLIVSVSKCDSILMLAFIPERINNLYCLYNIIAKLALLYRFIKFIYCINIRPLLLFLIILIIAEVNADVIYLHPVIIFINVYR